MNRENRSIWRRLALSAGLSTVVAFAILFAAERYLTAMVAEEYRTGARTTTGDDSIGLPVGALALVLAVIVIGVNAIVAIVLLRRSRRPMK